MRFRPVVLPLLAAASSLISGCAIDQTDLVYLNFDSPVLLPAFSPPSDSLHRARLSISIARPSARVRDGYFDTRQPNVDWEIDSITAPDNGERIALQRRSANNASMQWQLPSWQGSLALEFPLDDRSSLGLAAHGSEGPSGTRWFAEARLAIEGRTQAPLRFSLGGFFGRHNVRAAYLRRIDDSPVLQSWSTGRQEMGGFFADLALIPSSGAPAVVPVMGISVVHQRILVHRVPAPVANASTTDISEWMTLWCVSLGIRGRVTESVDVLVGARLVIDPDIDYTSTMTFVMPMAQVNMHF